MYVPLSDVSSSESEIDTVTKAVHEELGEKAVCQLNWHYNFHGIERQGSLAAITNPIINKPRYTPSTEYSKTIWHCHKMCDLGARFTTFIKIHSIHNHRNKPERGYETLGKVIISIKTCKLFPKYFTHLKTLIFNCSLECDSLKILCHKNMKHLSHLELNDCAWLTNKSMGYLKILPSLTIFKIGCSIRIKKGLFKLADATHLRKLTISNFKKIDNKFFLKLLSNFAYRLDSVSIKQKNKVFLNSELESKLQSMLSEGSIKKVRINGTLLSL